MKAMLLKKIGSPLSFEDIPIPKPKKNQVLIKVLACSVCRTDLHIFDGELPLSNFPLIMGHQIVGTIETSKGSYQKGDLVGIPWLGKSCGKCFFCKHEEENLCDAPTFTGYTINGGYAEFCVADMDFIFPIPKESIPNQVAPLLCAGMIGYRSWKLAKSEKKIGFYGFGAAASLLIQVANYHKQKIFAFTRKGDHQTQERAKKLGAVWAGDSETSPPDVLDAAIIFAPDGSLIPTALRAIRKGGKVICGGIHMSDIPSFPYEILWGERMVCSIANLTRQDGKEFLSLAFKIPIQTQATLYPLEKANNALEDLKKGRIQGSAVLIPFIKNKDA